ncbi:hypothetical protein BG011_005435 [Mortierella polycephala]|uniref:EF-hand domain-containing protein n=1 Tax=Mortierella polycephala TaxID=41804 RepID=A0A9P6U0Y0_9FUNG|nr:hypothetical protein BG011_005435 [Mortierella polycephala]
MTSRSNTTINTTTTSVKQSGVSPAYHKELQQTFQFYDTDGSGTLSTKRLRLAMRTLGFEASLKDIKEIVTEMPHLGVHKHKSATRSKRRSQLGQSKDKGKGKSKSNETGTSSDVSSIRRSSRSAAVASRTEPKSKYVDSSGDEQRGGRKYDGDNDNDDDDDDDDAGDIYRDEKRDTGNEEQDENDWHFTMEDFVAIMTPSEGTILLEDLRRIATELHIAMSDQELKEMIEEADKGGDGGVNEQDFARIMKKTGL